MTSSGRLGAPVRRTVTVLLTAIGLGSLAVAAVLVLVGPPEVTVSVTLTRWIQGVGAGVVVASLVFAIRWRVRVTTKPTHPWRYLSGTVVAAALAEAGFLTSVIGFLLSDDAVVIGVAGVVYILALLALASTAQTADLSAE